MSESTPTPEAEAAIPVLRMASQYVKDLSFENPNAPLSVAASNAQPEVTLEVNLGARAMGEEFPLGKDFYEIELSISATAKDANNNAVLYVVEVNFAGLALVQNVPSEHMGWALLVDCPQILFPYARRVVSDAVRDGGFAPLMLEPMDFAGMYRQKNEQAAAQAAASAEATDEA